MAGVQIAAMTSISDTSDARVSHAPRPRQEEANSLIERAIKKLRWIGLGDRLSCSALTEGLALERRSPNPGPLEALFFAHTGRPVHKWVHFLPIYDRVMATYRAHAPTMLEIGVSQGGSLELWRNYFGPKARIFGIDIEPACARRVDRPNQVRIGSQADPAFLRSLVAETGPLDIILDDGSHVGAHQTASLKALWPHLKVGGVYIIEDCHTAYWSAFQGGYRKPGTAIDLAKTLVDDLHGFYHDAGQRFVPRDEIGSVQMFDSIVVIAKVNRLSPGHYIVGG